MLRYLSLVLVRVAGSWGHAGRCRGNTSRKSWPMRSRLSSGPCFDRIDAKKRQPNLIPRLKKDADEEMRFKRYAQAVNDLEKAISNGADEGLTWLKLAQAQFANSNEDHAMASAYNAYRKSNDPAERGEALFIIGKDYDKHDKYKDALAAFEAGLTFAKSAGITERVAQLKALVAFRVVKVEVEAEADAARACLRFNEPVGTKGDISYGSYVRHHPGARRHRHRARRHDVPRRAEARHDLSDHIADRLAVGDRRKTLSDFKANVVIPDRKAVDQLRRDRLCAAARGQRRAAGDDAQPRPRQGAHPQVNERNLVPSIDTEKLTMSFGADDVEEIANRSGSLVWQGEMTIQGRAQPPGLGPRSR